MAPSEGTTEPADKGTSRAAKEDELGQEVPGDPATNILESEGKRKKLKRRRTPEEKEAKRQRKLAAESAASQPGNTAHPWHWKAVDSSIFLQLQISCS